MHIYTEDLPRGWAPGLDTRATRLPLNRLGLFPLVFLTMYIIVLVEAPSPDGVSPSGPGTARPLPRRQGPLLLLQSRGKQWTRLASPCFCCNPPYPRWAGSGGGSPRGTSRMLAPRWQPQRRGAAAHRPTRSWARQTWLLVACKGNAAPALPGLGASRVLGAGTLLCRAGARLPPAHQEPGGWGRPGAGCPIPRSCSSCGE